MTETDEMEELFDRLPWLGEQFEIEREIIEQLVMAELQWKRYVKTLEDFKRQLEGFT